MTEEEFAKALEHAPDRRLLEMLEFPAECVPEAIAAARKELERRALVPQERDAIRRTIQQERVEQAMREARTRHFQGRFKDVLEGTRDLVMDPRNEVGDRRWVMIMMVVLFLPVLLALPRIWSMLIQGSFMEGTGILTLDIFIPLVLLPITIILLHKRDLKGWSAGTVYVSFGLALASIPLLQMVRWWAEKDAAGTVMVMDEFDDPWDAGTTGGAADLDGSFEGPQAVGDTNVPGSTYDHQSDLSLELSVDEQQDPTIAYDAHELDLMEQEWEDMMIHQTYVVTFGFIHSLLLLVLFQHPRSTRIFNVRRRQQWLFTGAGFLTGLLFGTWMFYG